MRTKDRLLQLRESHMRRNQISAALAFVVVLALILTAFACHPKDVRAQGGGPVIENDYMTIRTIPLDSGNSLDEVIIHGPPAPPPGFEAERAAAIVPTDSEASKTLTVPAFDWVFGCSSVSGAMIAGYYDRNGYPNMYTGPTNGGVTPLDNSVWGTWSDGVTTYPNIPLAASHNGVDGRTTKGSIDDYWVQYGSSASDPYITGSWTQHTWSTAIGDYMKTSQSAYSNTDGSTSFYNWTSDSSPLTCADMVTNNIHTRDGTYGRKLFYEARGYTVTNCYSQKTDNTITSGFSYAQYKAEIDAGRPVMINLAGHTIVGVGYNDPSTVYIHDTWDHTNHSMTWGGSYSGMLMQSVSIVNLAASNPTVPVLVSPAGTVTDTTPIFKWKKVTGATQYRFQVYQGTTLKYTKTVPSSACGTTYCTNTPATVLAYAAHKWRAQAYIGGAWKTYSAYKNFTVSTSSGGFDSQFNGSTTGWSAAKGAWTNYASMYYRSAGLTSYFASAKYTTSYPNFTYQVRMKRVGTCTGCANRIIVRGNPSVLSSIYSWSPSYAFQYSNSGSFSVFELDSTGSAIALQTWTTSSAIVPNGWNTLKVVASGSSLKFYINGTLVWNGTDSTLTTGKVGFGFYRDTATGTLDVDWAKLTLGAADDNPFEIVAPGEELIGGDENMAP